MQALFGSDDGWYATPRSDGITSVGIRPQRDRTRSLRASRNLLWKTANACNLAEMRQQGPSRFPAKLLPYVALKMLALVSCLLLALAGMAAPGPPNSPSSSQVNSHFAIADLDGDAQPDLATVQVGQVIASDARYWIHVQLSSGRRQFIGVTAPVGGLDLALTDVNGDQNLDLVVTTSWMNRPVAVLLNDGHGNFTVRDPAAFANAIVRHDAYCSAAKVQINDATEVSTRAGGDCEEGRGASSIPRSISLLRFGFAQGFARWAGFRPLGRGPPFPVHHV
jgi:hypothetical protein